MFNYHGLAMLSKFRVSQTEASESFGSWQMDLKTTAL